MQGNALNLRYRLIEQAQIQAYLPPIVRHPDGFRGGIVLTEEADAPLRHTRARRPFDSFREDAVYKARLSGEYVYAGPVYGHFGHFMAEMAHRILPYKLLGLNYPLLFVTSQDWTEQPSWAHFPEYIKEILWFFEIKNHHVHVIKENTIVDKLHVVEAGSDLGGGPKSGYLEALRDYSSRRLETLHGKTTRPRKLYVSRSALEPQGFILGETYFERQLEKEGYTVFRPEEYRVTPQMDYYRKAEKIIFPEGSACHGAELLGAEVMNETYLLPRRDSWSAKSFGAILAPRSKFSAVMEGCVEFLGTASAHPRTGAPLVHIGASWLKLGQILDFCRQHGLANLKEVSKKDYAAAAEFDLQRYLAFQARPGAAWHAEFAEGVKAEFLKRAYAD